MIRNLRPPPAERAGSRGAAIAPGSAISLLCWLALAATGASAASESTPIATSSNDETGASAALAAVAPRSLQVITVTAEKRTAPAQSVPISLATLDALQLEQAGVRSAEDILPRLPNSEIAPAGGGKNNFFIRGVGTADFHLNAVGAIGLFIDEIPLNSPFAHSLGLLDPQRVEVLRGPQNTLLGRNAAGGAVHFLSREPELGERPNGYLRLGAGRYLVRSLTAAQSQPLGPTVALRWALSSDHRDSAFHNATQGRKSGESERHLVRLQLRGEPALGLDALLRLHAGFERGNPDGFKASGLLNPSDPSSACSVPANHRLPTQHPDCVDAGGFNHANRPWHQVFGNLQHRQDIDSTGLALRLDWQGEQLQLRSLTAFERMSIDYAEDADASPNTLFHFFQSGEHRQVSQELRLSSAPELTTRWIAGAFFYRERADYLSVVRRSPSPTAALGADRFQTVPNTIVEQTDRSSALFGQLDHQLNERLTLSAGLRYSDERKQGHNLVSVRCIGPIDAPLPCPRIDEQQFLAQRELLLSLPALVELPRERLDGRWRQWGGRLALSHQLDDDRLLYASLSRGFKGGGFSVAALQGLLGLSAADVDPERLDALELGLKADFPAAALRLNAALFHYRWRSLQSFQPLFDPDSGIAVPQLLNVPRSQSQGGEIELDWLPADGWSIQMGIGYLRARIDDAGQILGVQAGNTLPNAPRWSGNLQLRKEWSLGDGWFGLQGDARVRSRQSNDLANAPELELPSYRQYDLLADYRFGRDERFTLSLWAKNFGGEPRCAGLSSLAGLAESTTCLAQAASSEIGLGLRIEYP